MCKRIKFWVHILIIAALATAGISPACAFVSGKALTIEICTEDGQIKTIAMPGEQTPPPAQDHAHKDQDCAFCFAGSHNFGAIVKASFPAPLNAGYLQVGSGTAIPLHLAVKSFESTGPPALIS